MADLRDQGDVVLFSVNRALWDMVTSDVRAVSVLAEGRTLVVRVVYEGPISDANRELMSYAETEVISDFPWEDRVEFVLEVVPPPTPRTLLPDEHWVYLRHEGVGTY